MLILMIKSPNLKLTVQWSTSIHRQIPTDRLSTLMMRKRVWPWPEIKSKTSLLEIKFLLNVMRLKLLWEVKLASIKNLRLIKNNLTHIFHQLRCSESSSLRTQRLKDSWKSWSVTSLIVQWTLGNGTTFMIT